MKRFVRNITVTCAAIGFFIALIVLWATGNPPWSDLNFLIIIFASAVFAGSGALVASLFRKAVFPRPGPQSSEQIESPKQFADSKDQQNAVEMLNYTLGLKDIISFYTYGYRYFPRLVRSRKAMQAAIPFIIVLDVLAISLLLVLVRGTWVLPIVVILVILLAVTLLYFFRYTPLLSENGLKRWVLRRYGGPNLTIGKHKFSISSEGIADVTPFGRTVTSWDNAEYVASDDEYVFISVYGLGPYIVPRRAFANEEAFRQFVNTAKAYHQAAMSS